MSQSTKWLVITTAFAAISFVSFANINSVYADNHNLNGLFGYLGVGVVSGILAVLSLWKTFKVSN